MKGEFTQKGREAMDRFKMEAASEIGVNLSNGYNGDLTSRQAGSIGGQMVNLMSPEQQWSFDRPNRRRDGHIARLTFIMQTGI